MPTGGETRPAVESKLQHLAVQERVPLGRELPAWTLPRVGQMPEGAEPLTAEALRDMPQVTSLPDTSLVELAAVGGDPERLALVVNARINAYQELRRYLDNAPKALLGPLSRWEKGRGEGSPA